MTETEIRNALINRLSASASGAKAAFISEMFVDKFSRRADLVMANGKLSVFEIKSERDTLERLEGQISSYQNFFEEVTVVCATRHQVNVEALVPKNIGVWLIDTDGHLSVVRKAKAEQLPSIENWLSFLPVDELKKLLRHKGLRATGNRSNLVDAASLLPVKSVRTYVLSFLKRRDERIDTLRAKKVEKQTPSGADSTRFYMKQLHHFIESLPHSVSAIPRRITH
jgi:hypothetical protein